MRKIAILNQSLEKIIRKPSQNLTFVVTSSISKDGKLINMTSKFSDPSLSNSSDLIPHDQIPKLGKPITKLLAIESEKWIIPRTYILTISAKYEDDLTRSRIIDLKVK